MSRQEEPKLYDRISIDELETYMSKGIREFFVTEKDLYDQSKRIELCDKYFYYAFTCVDPYQMELCKMPDYVIKRIGGLKVVNNLLLQKNISSEYLESYRDRIIKDDF